MADLVTLDGIKKACDVLYKNPDIIQTPLLCHVQNMFPKIDQDVDLYLKLENMQTTGKNVFFNNVYNYVYWSMTAVYIYTQYMYKVHGANFKHLNNSK